MCWSGELQGGATLERDGVSIAPDDPNGIVLKDKHQVQTAVPVEIRGDDVYDCLARLKGKLPSGLECALCGGLVQGDARLVLAL